MATNAAIGDMEAAPVQVLIVDDSIVARAVLRRIIEGDPRYHVAAAVGDARAAIAFLMQERVDIVLLDIEMPGESGLSALPEILRAGRGARVLIVSSTSAPGAEASVRALALGAADTLVKPGAGVLAGRFAQALAERLARLSSESHAAAEPFEEIAAPVGQRREVPRVIAIGASTGGIHALGRLLGEFDAGCSSPILVTQHLPASFMPYFAAQLAQLAKRPCLVAEDRMRLRAGHLYVAPGDAHLTCAAMTDGYLIRLDRRPVESGCLPSVDPMLASVGDVFGTGAVGVVLSGMGRDGAVGARRLIDNGGTLMAQDRETSVVWGMPGAVASFAEAVLPPEAIGRALRQRFEGAR
ncbi:chemotaxis protein CheB [Sphingomonas sp. Y38-1Y]|uniref:chemotaxis protein CheB n=1 Tax=Sphingomonas sp. Y38-1Y TaxID=3078265 RepID=UPI0028E885A9|nr:chemotaxis protein CheB [Sphingomonas sp. Y38-1Y]